MCSYSGGSAGGSIGGSTGGRGETFWVDELPQLLVPDDPIPTDGFIGEVDSLEPYREAITPEEVGLFV